MIKTITMANFRRPLYTEQVLYSLNIALHNCPEFQPAAIVVGLDPGDPEEPGLAGILQAWATTRPQIEVLRWPARLGVDEHPRRLLQYVFQELGSDFNLHLEDDTVLSPDALRLAEWYSRSEHDTMALCLYSPSRGGEDPQSVVRVPGFNAWGWATTQGVWHEWLSPWWNWVQDAPYGWDWSITRLIERYSLACLAPALSRVRNIGKDGGTYATPATWEKDFAGLAVAGAERVRVEDFRVTS